MITVYKYSISLFGSALMLPKGSQILTVNFQDSDLCLWVKVDTEAEPEQRNFDVFETGREIPRNVDINRKYVGTAFTDDSLVFHVFERVNWKNMITS